MIWLLKLMINRSLSKCTTKTRNEELEIHCINLHCVWIWHTIETLSKPFVEHHSHHNPPEIINRKFSMHFHTQDVFKVLYPLLYWLPLPLLPGSKSSTSRNQAFYFQEPSFYFQEPSFYLLGTKLSTSRYQIFYFQEPNLLQVAFRKVKNILRIKLSSVVRKGVLKCYIESILLYACETWTLRPAKKHLIAAEMCF